jgi:hypothetical protein
MDLNFNKNEDHNKLLLSQLNLLKVKLGGGENALKNCMPRENDCQRTHRLFVRPKRQ